MKELKVALIGGAGFMGRAHTLGYAIAPYMKDIGLSVRREVLVDVDADAAASAADRLGWARSATDWRAVVEDPDIDIVDIVTPPALHEEVALAAIANGKHVFCEKPITNNSEAGLRMWEAAKKAGVVNQVGFNYRHISAISAIRKIIAAGKLGSTLQFRGYYHQDPLFFIEDFGWRGTRSAGGSGATGDIGSHILDIGQYLCGPIARVNGLQRAKSRGSQNDGWLKDLGVDQLDESSVWIAEFLSGAIGTFSTGFYSYGHKNHLGFSIDGTRGSVQFDWNRPDQFEIAYSDEPSDHSGFRTVLVSAEHPDVWYPVAGLGQGYIDGTAIQLRHFLEAIATNGSAHPTFGEAAHVQQIVEAITESSAVGSWIDVPVRPTGSAE